MVDEMRYPTVYDNEQPELKSWKEKYLKSQNILRTYAMEYNRHYAGSTACAPSRTTLFTGQYPSLHGVSQTTGLAKHNGDPDVFWLDPNSVPTMGDYFEAAGYRTFYKGKWHISDADIIIPGTTNSLDSFGPVTGIPNPEITELYLNANRLHDYGFNGWIGPEPHGSNPNNSASSSPVGTGGRDIVFTKEIIKQLKDLEKCPCDDPWLFIASFVNPHDITLYGDYSEATPYFNFIIDPTVPYIPPPPTHSENLSTKPTAQQSYKDVYPLALQPITNGEKYRKLYYSLQRTVDKHIQKVLKTIINSPMYKDTIIIFTSDHGDQLGAHGLFQKWHNFYEESVHVPLIIHSPVLFSGYNSTNKLTSHVDLIPTMLGLAGINSQTIIKKLSNRYSEAQPLVGKQMPMKLDQCQIKYMPTESRVSEPLYFWTQDNPTKGLNQTNPFNGTPYQSVTEPNSIESVIAYIDTESNHKQLYKYSRYYDPTNESTPNQYEMYNLTSDPLETQNLTNDAYSNPQTKKVQLQLEAILLEQRKLKRLVPKNVK